MICFNLLRRLAFAGLTITAGPLFAADVTSTWSATASGVWNADGNWINVPALGGFPNNGNGDVDTYDAVISATGSPYTVTLNTDITVEDLTLSSANATLNHTDGTFTATGAIVISAGTYQLDGGVISNTVVNVAGGNFVFTPSGGILSNNALFNGTLNLPASTGVRLQSGASFSGVANLSDDSYLGIEDSLTLTGRTINLNGSGVNLLVEGAITLTLGTGTLVRGQGTIGNQFFVGGAHALVNAAGTIRADLGQALSIITSSFTNQAGGVTEAINGSTLTIGATNASNAGTINANASTVNLAGTFSNLGVLNTSNAGVINLTGTFNNSGNYTFPGTGSLTFAGGTISGGQITQGVGGQTLIFTPSAAGILSNNALFNGTLDLPAGTGVRLQSGASFSGVANLGDGSYLGIESSLTLTGRTINLNGSAANLLVDGAITLTLGAGTLVRGQGTIGNQFFVGGAHALVNAAGTIRADLGQALSIVTNSFTNQAGAVTEAINGSTLTIGATNASNAGTINANASTVNLASTFSNLGVLNTSNAGVINLTGTFNNSGNYTFPGTGSLTLLGGTISGGQITPGGGGQTLIFTPSAAGILSNNALFNGTLDLPAGTGVRLQSGASFSGVANLGDGSYLGIEDSLTLTGRTINLNGSGVNLLVEGAITLTLGTGTLVRGQGTIGNQFFVGGAHALVNAAGTIRADLGQALSIITSSFTNQATLEVVNDSTLSTPNGFTQTAGVTRVSGGTINSPTINIVSGTLEGTGTINADVTSAGIINLDSGGMIVGTLNATGGAWNGQGSVSGLATASGGMFTIGSGANMTALGGLNVTGTGRIAAANGTAKITGSVSYLSSSNSTFGGIIAGAGKTLTMNNGAATLTLAGANTYTGATTVTAGILKAGAVSVSGTNGAFGLNSAVSMANSASAKLDITGFDTQIGSLSGGGASGGNVILGAATLTFGGNNPSPAFYRGTISGSGGITKIGLGTQPLSAANTYTGWTTIGAGTLKLDFTNLATPTNIINSASALTLGGGTLSVLGKPGAGVITSQTLGDVTLNTGTFSTIALDPNNSGAGSTTLTLGNAWTHNAGSTLLIDYSSANTGTRRVRTTGAVTGTGAAGANGIFGYALVKDSGGTGFATQDGSFNFVRNTVAGTVLTTSNSVAGTTATDFTTASTDPGYSGVGGTLTLDNVAHAASTLSINTTGGGTLNLGGAAGAFALSSGAVLVQGTGNYTIQNGALGASGTEVIVHHIGSGLLTISSPISGGAGGLTRDGSGTLTLTGLQDYATLSTGAGITNLQVALGTGSSTINANARTNLTTSQTLVALNIGAGGVVTLTENFPAALAGDAELDGAVNFDDASLPAGAFGEQNGIFASQDAMLTNDAVQAVPEPGSLGLLLLGAMAMLRRRQR